MKEGKWERRWRNLVAPTELPGVWQRKDGGHLVRAKVTDPSTKARREIRRVLPHMGKGSAYKWLQDEIKRVKAGGGRSPQAPKTRFADYAVSLLEKKTGKAGRIKSAKSRERWVYTLVHIIEGTEDVPGLGAYFIEEIRPRHLAAWRDGLARLVERNKFKPTTINGWFSIMRVIFKAATWELQLPQNPMDGVENFDTSTHSTYTVEEPNSLSPEEARVFLEAMQLLYPQHYAMTYVAVATGLRPSSLRPLRRKGPEPDVLWDTKELLIRRSQTVGDEVMQKTKTGIKQRIALPDEVMAVLKWHVDTQLSTPEMQASDLLFPSVLGGFRSPTVLNKPFADVAERIGLGKKFTQRGLRRTFNDLARAAQIESMVTKKISGHQTDAMVERYSTVRVKEQQDAIRALMATMDEKPDEPTAKDDKPKADEATAEAKHADAEPSACGSNSVAGVPPCPVTQTEAEQPSAEGARHPS